MDSQEFVRWTSNTGSGEVIRRTDSQIGENEDESEEDE